MFSFERAEFLSEPYAIGLIKPIMDQDLYDSLVDTFPSVELFEYKSKFGKKYTVINGINEHEVDIKGVAKKLKSKFACGGTAKQGIVELQGDHTRDIRKELIKLGFAPDSIE